MTGHEQVRSNTSQNDRQLYRRLWQLARPYSKCLAALLLLDLLESLWLLLTPVPMKVAIDSVVGSQPLPGWLAFLLPQSVTATALMLVLVGLLLAVALLNGLQTLGSTLLRGYVGERLVLDFRGLLFRHAQRLPTAYHDSQGTTDATFRIQHDAASVEAMVESTLPLVSAGLKVVLTFAVTLWLDWQLALAAALAAPILIFLSGRYRPRLRQRAHEVRKLESSALGVVQEVLSLLRVVKAFGQEEREQARFLERSREGMRARLRLLAAEGSYGLAIRLTAALGTATVLFIGVTHVRGGTLTLGELLLILTYLAQLYNPLKMISRKAGGLQAHLVSAERAFALLDQPPEVPERPDARPLGRATGALSLRNVTFGYDADPPVLRDVSLDIPPGARLGIVGTTGAGKTTLLNLLMRFHDPQEGALALDGVDLRDYRLADLRHQFGLVLQDAVLLSASVADNIAYARPGATQAEIEAAARQAQAHDFITRLPQGYDTPVGERGMRLSGGERQRLGLARAFLKDAPILLLDEPTSAIDPRTEAGILEALERLMQGRTCIIITHRPTPLAGCDTVLVLDQGRLRTQPLEPALS